MAGKKRPVAAQVAERKNPKRAGAKPTPEQSAQSNLAKRIRARWGSSREKLPLDRLETDLAGSRRHDIVVALKELEKAGLGEFAVDPEGHTASFVWIKRKPPAANTVTRAPLAQVGSKPPVANTASKPPVSKASPSRASASKPPASKAPVSKPSLRTERHASAVWERAPKRRSQPEPVEPAAQSLASGTALVPHTFQVRPEVPVTFHLPEDVTRAEIERLCLSLQALPVG